MPKHITLGMIEIKHLTFGVCRNCRKTILWDGVAWRVVDMDTAHVLQALISIQSPHPLAARNNHECQSQR